MMVENAWDLNVLIRLLLDPECDKPYFLMDRNGFVAPLSYSRMTPSRRSATAVLMFA